MKNSGETGIVLNECCPLQRSQVCAGLAQRENESAMGLEIAASRKRQGVGFLFGQILLLSGRGFGGRCKSSLADLLRRTKFDVRGNSPEMGEKGTNMVWLGAALEKKKGE